MGKICFETVEWVTKTVFDPVDTWVSKQEQHCKKLPWWHPLKWLCWIVTTVVKVVVWVAKTIEIAVFSVICYFVTWLIGAIMLPFAAAIDAICWRCNAVAWVMKWFIRRTKVTFLSSSRSTTQPGLTDYVFHCNCKKDALSQSITITASNDKDAADEAAERCTRICG